MDNVIVKTKDEIKEYNAYYAISSVTGTINMVLDVDEYEAKKLENVFSEVQEIIVTNKYVEAETRWTGNIKLKRVEKHTPGYLVILRKED